MNQYETLLKYVYTTGIDKSDRTGVGIISIFGYQMRFDLAEGFPLVTTKKVHLKSIIHELLWFLKGDTNIKYLKDNGVRIWDEWADENGELGSIYRYQWRSWPAPDGRHIDQISNIIHTIKNNPDSRKIIDSAWNVADIDNMALPTCHTLFQFYVVEGKLSCQLYQRSADLLLSVPFNIASFALLTMMLAEVCDLEYGDVHIYKNHFKQVELQLMREPRRYPVMNINQEIDTIFNLKYEDFSLDGYNPHPSIKVPIAV